MNLFAYKLTVALLLMLGCGDQLIAMGAEQSMPAASSIRSATTLQESAGLETISRNKSVHLSDISQIPSECFFWGRFLYEGFVDTLHYHLCLESYSIEAIDGCVFEQIAKQLPLLGALNLSRNKLKILPKEIGLLANLTSLILNDNMLEKLPKTVGNLRGLHVLGLGNNRLEDLPLSALVQLHHLKAIDLRGNPLVALADWSKVYVWLLAEFTDIAIFPFLNFNQTERLKKLVKEI